VWYTYWPSEKNYARSLLFHKTFKKHAIIKVGSVGYLRFVWPRLDNPVWREKEKENEKKRLPNQHKFEKKRHILLKITDKINLAIKLINRFMKRTNKRKLKDGCKRGGVFFRLESEVSSKAVIRAGFSSLPKNLLTLAWSGCPPDSWEIGRLRKGSERLGFREIQIDHYQK